MATFLSEKEALPESFYVEAFYAKLYHGDLSREALIEASYRAFYMRPSHGETIQDP